MTRDRTLEERLKELQTVERFEPPEQFRKAAQVSGEWIYDEAATDRLGFWAQQARELHWHTPFTTVLDDSNPPFYRWFTDGSAQRLVQLPGPPRRGGPWRQGRVPLGRRGRRDA